MGIKIVSETKKKTEEKEPPTDIEFQYLPGKTDKVEMKKFLSRFL